MPALSTATGRLWIWGGANLSSPIPSLSANGGFRLVANGSLISERPLEARGGFRFRGRIANAVQSAKIAALAQTLNTEPLIQLFQLDLSRFGLGIAYFTPTVHPYSQPLRFGGQAYYPAPVEATGFERRGEGSEPRPRLKLPAVNPLITSLIQEGRDLAGCELRRIRTFRRFLDDGAEPNTDDQFIKEIWQIDRLAHLDNESAEFELSTFIDVGLKQLPGRRILRDYCDFVYRRWDSQLQMFIYDEFDPCPYTGAAYFDKNNAAAPQEKDFCGKRLASCKRRFGQTAILPFRGFPGVGRVK